MSIPLTETRRVARRRRALGYWGVLLGMYVSLWLGNALAPDGWLHWAALFAHLASVIVGLGAAVTVEVRGLQWALGRGTLDDVRRTEHASTAIAWLGIIGLLASGALLHPDLSDPRTAIKMIAVLAVALNGVAMSALADDLARLPGSIPFSRVPSALQLRCLASAAVSQLGWWTAVIVGMLNTASH